MSIKLSLKTSVSTHAFLLHAYSSPVRCVDRIAFMECSSDKKKDKIQSLVS
jgi:hypothetical protein